MFIKKKVQFKYLPAFLLILFFGENLSILAQTREPNYIKTVQIKESGKDFQNNIIALGNKIEVSFDDLEADQKNYYYKIQHMSHDWKESELLPSQYINGFQKNIILNSENSFNTFQNYTHYEFTIPNQNTVLTKSGNYLVSVLDEYDEVVFARRVTFYESLSTVGVTVSRSRDAKKSNQEQTVQFTVNHPEITMNFPDREVFVAVLQNQNWKTSINNLKPQFYKQNQLIYKYVKKSNFLGGNEYLNFDMKSIRNQSVTIKKVVRKELFNNYIYPIESKLVKNYTYSPDINGQFLIRTIEGKKATVEADYVIMHFSLIPLEEERNLDLYVYGGFNNFELNDQNLMSYNESNNSFEASILLKQGFYNYIFASVEKSGTLNTGAILGNFSKTENRYDVIVYFRPIGGLYDRAIGLGTTIFKGEF